MKLETTQDLLERVRAKHNSSWWGLSKVIPASESTVNNWKHGRSAIGREYVTRIAELLEEPAEYVLACVEHEREQDAGAKKLWRRIAERFRSTASILLLGLVGVGLGSPTQSDAYIRSTEASAPGVRIMVTRRRKLAGWLRLKTLVSVPIRIAPWARIRSTGSLLRCFVLSPAPI